MYTYTEVLLGDLRIPEFAEEKPLGLRANAEIYNLFGFNCFRFLVSDRAFSVAVPADACSNANVHATYNRLLVACAAAGDGPVATELLQPGLISVPKLNYVRRGYASDTCPLRGTYMALNIPHVIVLGDCHHAYACHPAHIGDCADLVAKGSGDIEALVTSDTRIGEIIDRGYLVKFADVCTWKDRMPWALAGLYGARYVPLGESHETHFVLDGLGKTAAERYEAYCRFQR
jgi:hypothetical protein